MATYLLRDVLDTRYLYVSIITDFAHVFDTIQQLKADKEFKYFAGNNFQKQVFEDVIAGNELVFDTRDCRMTSDFAPYVTNAIRKGFKFIDTKDTRRNRIYEESAKRKPVEDAVLLPKYNPTEDPVEYIKRLDKNVVYALPLNLSNAEIALIILATMSRPKLQFALGATHGVILDTVAEVITISVLSNYTEFYYCSPEGIDIVQLEGNAVYTQRRGLCTLAEACEAGSLVPTVFGSKKLIADPMWEPLVTVCVAAVNSSRQASPKSLYEVLKGVNE